MAIRVSHTLLYVIRFRFSPRTYSELRFDEPEDSEIGNAWTSNGSAQCIMRMQMRNHILLPPLVVNGWRRFVGATVLPFLCCSPSWPQQTPQTVQIAVHANQTDGTIAPIWTYFGYDEPNYSYAPNGKKLLAELATLSPTPAYVRVHNMLTSGDGSSSLKWGSTNAYTENAAGGGLQLDYSRSNLRRISLSRC